jgi:uracil-DNA glycosylase family 4
MNEVAEQYLRQQRELGFRTLYLPEEGGPAVVPQAPAAPPLPASADGNGKEGALSALYAANQSCARCQLSKTRDKFVFGSGNANARLMFIGEAPGADEDRQGLPFVGRAGQLLTKMIENGMGIPRKEVYIANILKCRPPGNRDPLPAEREQCTPVLIEQIRIIKPEFICCLGRISGRFLLGLDDTIPLKAMRQRFYEFMGARVCVTYHPSALLQHAEWKKDAWADLKFLIQAMGLVIPPQFK